MSRLRYLGVLVILALPLSACDGGIRAEGIREQDQMATVFAFADRRTWSIRH